MSFPESDPALGLLSPSGVKDIVLKLVIPSEVMTRVSKVHIKAYKLSMKLAVNWSFQILG